MSLLSDATTLLLAAEEIEVFADHHGVNTFGNPQIACALLAY